MFFRYTANIPIFFYQNKKNEYLYYAFPCPNIEVYIRSKLHRKRYIQIKEMFSETNPAILPRLTRLNRKSASPPSSASKKSSLSTLNTKLSAQLLHPHFYITPNCPLKIFSSVARHQYPSSSTYLPQKASHHAPAFSAECYSTAVSLYKYAACPSN